MEKVLKISLLEKNSEEIIFPTTSPNRKIQFILFQMRQGASESMHFYLLL